MPRSCLVFVSLWFTVVAARAGDPSPKLILETWDAAYLQGNKSGYVHTTVYQFSRGNKKIYRTTAKLVLNLRRFDTKIQLRMDTGTEETNDGKVTGVFMRQYLGANKKLDITGTVAGKQLKLVLDKKKPLSPAPWNDAVVGLYRQQSLFKERNVKKGDEFSYLSFEPSINLVVETKVKVKDYETVELFHGKIKKKLLRVEVTPQRIQGVQLPTMVYWLDRGLEPIRSQANVPGMGLLTLYRTTKTDATTGGAVAKLTDIGLNQLILLKRRIVRPYESSAAVYRVRLTGADDPTSAFANDLRQNVKNVQGQTLELHVKAGPVERAVKPAEEYRQSCYFINSKDGRVKALAQIAVGAERDPWKKALRIEKWVKRNMKGRNHEAMATADHVARTLQGDCSEFAMLMAAMCRAQGIPSRTAIGLIYADTNRGPAFSFHMWTEVWIDGRWLGLDATLGRGRVGATHLKITDHSWQDTRSLTPMLPLLRVLGRTSIDVVRVQ